MECKKSHFHLHSCSVDQTYVPERYTEFLAERTTLVNTEARRCEGSQRVYKKEKWQKGSGCTGNHVDVLVLTFSLPTQLIWSYLRRPFFKGAKGGEWPWIANAYPHFQGNQTTRQNFVRSGFKCAVAHVLVGIVNEEIFSAISVKIEDMGWHAS